MSNPDWRNAYLRLHPRVALKMLEQPYVYHIGGDELYEIDEKAVDFFLRCNGAVKGETLTTETEFVEYCFGEGLLEALPEPDPVPVSINEKITPTLRYLELQLTRKCNLTCSHCYLGDSGVEELSLSDAVAIAREFAGMGGLRLLISGGEPMLYKELKQFIALTKAFPIRRILFSNGTLINSDILSWLDVDEIQFSLDGWEKGHEAIRGAGSFKKTMAGIHAAVGVGMPISFATMIHRENLDEFDRMKEFIENIGAIEWGIDVMCVAGSLEKHQDLTVPYEEAVPFLDYAFGGGYHGSSDGYACGRHLMTVMPDGRAVKCGFYRDSPVGDARKGLKDCWLKMEHILLKNLECADCLVLEDCRGGCRFRAPHPLAPDPAMCCYYGIHRQP
jgi:radical SAM protein with 4Fe4S-binding SPASM domain